MRKVSRIARTGLAGLGLFYCGFFCRPAALSAQPTAPTLVFGSSEVIASGISPGGRAVFFAVTQEVAEDEVITLRRRDAVRLDADGDGVVSFDLGGPVAPRAIWLAVDLLTGAFVLTTPSGDPPSQVAFEGEGLVLGGPLEPSDSIADARTFLEVLLVRPGASAWARTIADGGAGDADGKADGAVEAALDTLLVIDSGGESPPPPSRFVAQDLVFAFSPISLEVVTASASTLLGGVQ